MPSFSMKNAEEVQDFVRGCTFYATGGGGSPEYGRDLLNRVLEKRKSIQVIDVSEVDDDAWTCSAYGMGSIAPRTQKVLDEIEEMGLTQPTVEYKLLEAVRELEKHTETKVSVIAPVEIGGANAPDPVATANLAGLKVVDGDYSGGRAMPEAVHSMPHIKGNLMMPLASVDEWGNTVILRRVYNNKSAEKIGKLVAVLAYGNLAGNATWLFKGAAMKRLITPGTLSRALETGVRLRELRENRVSLQAFVEAIKGYYLFKGTVVSKAEENRDAEYYWGSYSLEGSDEFRNHTLKVWFKNENHMSWLDGRTYVMTPDLITSLDVRNMEPIVNPRIRKGDQLAIIGLRSINSYRTKAALESVGPKHFGFDMQYVPIEKMVG